MTTNIKCELNQQSKAVVASVKIESDELTADEVLQQTKEAFEKAKAVADTYTALSLR